jgi:hypothetical protein
MGVSLRTMRAIRVVMALMLCAQFTLLACANAAAKQAATASGGSGSSGGDKAPLKQEELDQLVAPIALYPDALVSQILMASTYPLEVVEANRWVTKNSTLKGDALAKALEAQTWDPSVKSLVNFPQVLTMMSDELEWMVKLGDAFIAQQQQVMDTIQSLRAKAEAAGNLKSSDQQVVTTEKKDNTQVIVIESKNPDVIYVPTYDPVVVYGAWPYPAYPPYYYYPPGYVAGTAALSFGVGVACGLAWGYAWGHCDWHHNDVNININQNINRNTNINRSNINANIKNGQWQHDASHRKGVAYRDSTTAQKYGKTGSPSAVQAREQFRGRAEAGQRDISSGRVNAGNVGATRDQPRTGGGTRAGTGASGTTRDASRAAGAGGATRDGSQREGPGSSGGSGGGAFSGSNRSGSETRANSSRGQSSRSGASGGRSTGGSRGGGGARSGGGRR